jgi:tetratricopeptide (TPR) repeat protein
VCVCVYVCVCVCIKPITYVKYVTYVTYVSMCIKPTPSMSAYGNQAYREGDSASAISKYRAAVAADPALPYAWTNLGNCLLEIGAVREAVGAYRRTLRLVQEAEGCAVIGAAGAGAGTGTGAGAGVKGVQEVQGVGEMCGDRDRDSGGGVARAKAHYNLAVSLHRLGRCHMSICHINRRR